MSYCRFEEFVGLDIDMKQLMLILTSLEHEWPRIWMGIATTLSACVCVPFTELYFAALSGLAIQDGPCPGAVCALR